MTYEYVCKACAHEWEVEQKITDEPIRKCPQCGEEQAKRLVSGGGGFRLIGNGWAADGYGTK